MVSRFSQLTPVNLQISPYATQPRPLDLSLQSEMVLSAEQALNEVESQVLKTPVHDQKDSSAVKARQTQFQNSFDDIVNEYKKGDFSTAQSKQRSLVKDVYNAWNNGGEFDIYQRQAMSIAENQKKIEENKNLDPLQKALLHAKAYEEFKGTNYKGSGQYDSFKPITAIEKVDYIDILNKAAAGGWKHELEQLGYIKEKNGYYRADTHEYVEEDVVKRDLMGVIANVPGLREYLMQVGYLSGIDDPVTQQQYASDVLMSAVDMYASKESFDQVKSNRFVDWKEKEAVQQVNRKALEEHKLKIQQPQEKPNFGILELRPDLATTIAPASIKEIASDRAQAYAIFKNAYDQAATGVNQIAFANFEEKAKAWLSSKKFELGLSDQAILDMQPQAFVALKTSGFFEKNPNYNLDGFGEEDGLYQQAVKTIEQSELSQAAIQKHIDELPADLRIQATTYIDQIRDVTTNAAVAIKNISSEEPIQIYQAFTASGPVSATSKNRKTIKLDKDRMKAIITGQDSEYSISEDFKIVDGKGIEFNILDGVYKNVFTKAKDELKVIQKKNKEVQYVLDKNIEKDPYFQNIPRTTTDLGTFADPATKAQYGEAFNKSVQEYFENPANKNSVISNMSNKSAVGSLSNVFNGTNIKVQVKRGVSGLPNEPWVVDYSSTVGGKTVTATAVIPNEVVAIEGQQPNNFASRLRRDIEQYEQSGVLYAPISYNRKFAVDATDPSDVKYYMHRDGSPIEIDKNNRLLPSKTGQQVILVPTKEQLITLTMSLNMISDVQRNAGISEDQAVKYVSEVNRLADRHVGSFSGRTRNEGLTTVFDNLQESLAEDISNPMLREEKAYYIMKTMYPEIIQGYDKVRQTLVISENSSVSTTNSK